MQVTIEDTAPCRKTLRIEIPVEEVDAAMGRALSAFRKASRIPGFRPGKAPDQLVRTRYAKDIQEEVRQDLVPRGYQQALKQEKLDVVAVLGVGDVELEEGKPMRFNVVLDVPPAFDLPDYRSFSLEQKTVEVGDEQVEEAIKRLLEQFAGYEPAEDRPVEKGDLVQVDYEGTLDGAPLEEAVPEAKGLGTNEDFWVRTDEDSFLPGFGDALVGLTPGDKKDITVTFPSPFAEEKLAGREAVYAVTVKGLRERKIPALDEALLTRLEVDSEEDLRNRIREDLQKGGEREEQARLRNEMSKILLEKTVFDVPGSEVEEETRQIIRDIVHQNTSRGVERDQIEQNRDEIFTAASRNAQDSVKIRYILHRIAEEEELSVTETEFQQHLDVTAQGYGMEPAQFRSELESRSALDNVRQELRNRKAMDFLLALTDGEH